MASPNPSSGESALCCAAACAACPSPSPKERSVKTLCNRLSQGSNTSQFTREAQRQSSGHGELAKVPRSALSLLQAVCNRARCKRRCDHGNRCRQPNTRSCPPALARASAAAAAARRPACPSSCATPCSTCTSCSTLFASYKDPPECQTSRDACERAKSCGTLGGYRFKLSCSCAPVPPMPMHCLPPAPTWTLQLRGLPHERDCSARLPRGTVLLPKPCPRGLLVKVRRGPT